MDKIAELRKYGKKTFSAAVLCFLLACSEEPRAMVSSAHPLATRAGVEILSQGGNALDAAIAAQLVLSLVEPQSSGLGGGAFLLFYDGAKTTSWDGRETAPANARGDIFLDSKGVPVDFFKAVVGGQSVGVPGLVAMMEAAHKKSGVLAWAKLFAPAIELARAGFPLSQRLAWWIGRDPFLARTKAAPLFFNADGTPKKEGALVKNPAFADTLEKIAGGGAAAFYQGAVADAIVRAVGDKNNFSKKDLRAYKPKERAPLCGTYHQYKICSQAPPSAGGITLLQILGIVENFPLKDYAPQSVEAVHLISEASRLAFADRGRYIADPDFFAVPTQKLLDKNYLKKRAALIRLNKKISNPPAGRLLRPLPPSQDDRALPSTTHLSVVDRQGKAVSLTSSIEGPFGSHIFVRGFFLNNELTDFSFRPRVRGKLVANRLQGGKRPLSSMTPTLIFAPNGSLFAVLGSPGGRRIPVFVAQSVIALLDWKQTMADAIALPRHTALGAANRAGDKIELEPDLASLKKPLEGLGHLVEVRPLTSGLHGIRIRAGKLDGGADPRRDGLALGVR